jgi:hypothetical protein
MPAGMTDGDAIGYEGGEGGRLKLLPGAGRSLRIRSPGGHGRT